MRDQGSHVDRRARRLHGQITLLRGRDHAAGVGQVRTSPRLDHGATDAPDAAVRAAEAPVATRAFTAMPRADSYVALLSLDDSVQLIRDAGDPVEVASRYDEEGADVLGCAVDATSAVVDRGAL